MPKPKKDLHVNFAKKFEQVINNINPDVDYLEYNHLTGVRNNIGQFKRFKDPTDMFFECRIAMIHRCKHTGREQRSYLYYIPHDHKSLSLTIIDLDAVANCYHKDKPDDIELVYAVSTIKPLLKERFDALLAANEISLDKFNLRFEAVDEEVFTIY